MFLSCILSYLPHLYTRRPCVVDASTDVPSSPSQPTYALSLSNVGAAVLEQTSYLFVVHTKWHLAMIEDIATVECIDTWDIVSLPPHVRPITWWATRLRLAPMVLLSITKRVVWLVAYNGSMALFMMTLFAGMG